MHIESSYQDGIPPYRLVDKGYPLLSWILMPFKDDGRPRSLVETYYNKCHRCGRNVVENAPSLLKENWSELSRRMELHMTIVLDVVYTCYILHTEQGYCVSGDFESGEQELT